MTTEITGYWTFFCNPQKWEIDKFLETDEIYDTYRINDWYTEHVKAGQLAVIKVGVDDRTKKELNGRKKLLPGIYAVVEILHEPKLMKEKSDFYLDEKEKKQDKLRVTIKYLKNLRHSPLLIGKLKANSIINQDKFLINGFQRSSMPLRKDVFEEITSLIVDTESILKHVQLESADTWEQLIKLNEKYLNATPEVKEVVSKQIERGKISSDIKRINNYKCQICEAFGHNPYSFTKKNGNFYIETHHIIPVSNLIEGTLGARNLITVCANHHRQLHYGNAQILPSEEDLILIQIDDKKIAIPRPTFAST